VGSLYFIRPLPIPLWLLRESSYFKDLSSMPCFLGLFTSADSNLFRFWEVWLEQAETLRPAFIFALTSFIEDKRWSVELDLLTYFALAGDWIFNGRFVGSSWSLDDGGILTDRFLLSPSDLALSLIASISFLWLTAPLDLVYGFNLCIMAGSTFYSYLSSTWWLNRLYSAFCDTELFYRESFCDMIDAFFAIIY